MTTFARPQFVMAPAAGTLAHILFRNVGDVLMTVRKIFVDNPSFVVGLRGSAALGDNLTSGPFIQHSEVGAQNGLHTDRTQVPSSGEVLSIAEIYGDAILASEAILCGQIGNFSNGVLWEEPIILPPNNAILIRSGTEGAMMRTNWVWDEVPMPVTS